MRRRKTLNTAALCALVAHAGGAPAQDLVLEEILVTATKRAVGMQDVPIALSVVSGEQIYERGMGTLEDLAVYIPNVLIAESIGGDQLFIRGIGSGENYGFEQSVGSFIDGVYFGRGQASRSAFLDIERVEILKGPQSTLFGKNTIAGAINITTARPTADFLGVMAGSIEPEFDGWETVLTVSGPLGDTLRGRLALKHEESDGYVRNTLLRRDEPQEENSVGRVSLDWDATADLNVFLKYEYGESEVTGRQLAVTIATEESTALYQTADPDFEAAFDYNKSAQGIDDPRARDESHDADWNIATLIGSWDIGGYNVRSTTGYVDYSFSNSIDADLGPLRFLARDRDETHEQFSQEFLLSSPLTGGLEYLAGIYFQDEDLASDRATHAVPSVLGIGTGDIDASSQGRFRQDTTTYSAFTQLTWHFNADWRLLAGIRYSHDEKKFTKAQYMAELFENDPSERLGAVYDGLLNFLTDHSFDESGAERCTGAAYTCEVDPDFDNERTEGHTTGDITLQWDATDGAMLYAKVGNGYKAGGFDEDNVRGFFDAQEYGDETVIGGEVGAKIGLLGGRGRLNTALFYNEFDDVQVAAFDGNSAFVVDNAAESESRGLEADLSLLVTEALTLRAAAAWLEASYKSFPDAACTNAQAREFEESGGQRNQCVQDLSGEELLFSPEYSGNIGLVYLLYPGDNLELQLGADILFSDSYQVSSDNDSAVEQDAYTKFNSRVALSSLDRRWMVAAIFKNITDEETTVFGGDVPLAELGFDETYLQFIDAPRSVEIQVRLEF